MDRSHLLQGLRTGGPNKLGASQPSPSVSRFQNPFAYDDGQPGVLDAQTQQLMQQQQLAILQAQAQMTAMMQGAGGAPNSREAQTLMQMEMLRLQALQQQQQNLQAQMLLQSQIAAASRQVQNHRRASEQLPSPALAGPITPLSDAQTTRMTAANQLRARTLGREAIAEEQPQVSPPASARIISTPLNPNAAAFVGRFKPDLATAIAAANNNQTNEAGTPSTPTYGQTSVISGGTSLGSAHPSNAGASTPIMSNSGFNSPTVNATPTKADTATSWRRGSSSVATTLITNNSGFSKPPSPPLRQRSISPPFESSMAKLNISPSSSTDGSTTPSSAIKIRPSPLRFSKPNTEESIAAPAFARSQSPSGLSDASSHRSNISNSNTSPTNSTPPSSASSDESHKKVVAEREEASKRLYEGLGIGRPVPSPGANKTSFNVHAAPFTLQPRAATMPVATPVRHDSVSAPVSVPHRQPIGPPSGADELGPRNFASRLRKKALGSLGVLMDAKERREGFAPAGFEVTAY